MAEANFPSKVLYLNGSCYMVVAMNPNEIWKSGNVLENQGPRLCIQIAFSIFTANFLYQILRPLHQPRIVAELLAGFILSPLLLGKTILVQRLLPPEGTINIETYASIGVMGYVFLSGLEMNLDNILQVQKKATGIAMVGIIIPMVMGLGFFSVIQKVYEKPTDLLFLEDDKNIGKAYLFWSLALTFTGFPVLARILADLKLLYTRLGRVALSAAMISNTYGWVLFIILIPFSSNNPIGAIFSVLSTIVFILLCIFALRPLIARFIDEKIDQDKWDDSQLLLVLMGAFVCSYITDALGTHSIVGAFVYGLILPHGRFTDLVMGKLDNFVSGAISPIFFFRSGLMVNLWRVGQQKYWPLMILTIILLSTPKIVSTLIATFFFGMPIRDGVRIGLLLNSKGVLALIILNIAWERKILSEVAFSIMVCAVFLMTIMVPFFINIIYKPRKRYDRHRQSTIEKLRTDAELRILTCVHNIRQASSMVSVLKTCNATRIAPLHVFGVHLVERTGRATTFYAAQMEQPAQCAAQNLTQPQRQLESITNTFNALAEANHAVRVNTFSAVSAYETIHEDIYSLAEQQRTALILLPFHKQPNAIGGLETTNVAYGDVNRNVLQDAPCSVAIFVDRGLGSLCKSKLRILMLFVGGPDDREALAVAWRMAGHPGNQLSMVRILLSGEAAEVDILAQGETQWLPSIVMDDDREKALDDEYVDSFRFKAVYNDDSITYSEEEVHSGEELTLLLHELDKDDCDLYIVGQGSGKNSMVFSKSLEWCDNPELGVIGDMVASNSFDTRSSLLVVQQFGSGGLVSGGESQHPTQFPKKSDGSEMLVMNTV